MNGQPGSALSPLERERIFGAPTLVPRNRVVGFLWQIVAGKNSEAAVMEIQMGLRWWRDVLILSQPKRYLDDRYARKYWLISFGEIRLDHLHGT